MGGAFVGVANDASATYWNPAGLATGGPMGFTVDWTHLRTGDPNAPPTPGASRRESKFTSFSTLPVGISLLQTTETYIVSSVGGALRTDSLRTGQLNLTLIQTVVDGLVVATTLKYIRGSVTSAPVIGNTTSAVFDNADNLERHETRAFDMDIAAMVDFHYVRAGVTVKNVTEPTFSNVDSIAMSLQRSTRVGVAVLPTSGLTLAVDLDLDTVDLRDGPRRMLALGGEQRLGKKIVARGGARWNRAGSGGPAKAVGGSLLVREHMWLDAYYTTGGALADHGWGIATRAGF
jgi:hypothetical protein